MKKFIGKISTKLFVPYLIAVELLLAVVALLFLLFALWAMETGREVMSNEAGNTYTYGIVKGFVPMLLLCIFSHIMLLALVALVVCIYITLYKVYTRGADMTRAKKIWVNVAAALPVVANLVTSAVIWGNVLFLLCVGDNSDSFWFPEAFVVVIGLTTLSCVFSIIWIYWFVKKIVLLFTKSPSPKVAP